jgi:hypothetical protein
MSSIRVTKSDLVKEGEVHIAERAQQVYSLLLKANRSMKVGFLDTMDLLTEAADGNYHSEYGYVRLGDWVEASPELDMSPRQAYYLINIKRKADKLGISRAQLEACSISQLKEIFALDPADMAHDMRKLLDAAPDQSLEDTKAAVKKLRKDSGQPAPEYMTLKLDPAVKELADRAIELARMNYGDTVDEGTGEVKEASVSQAMELIFASYLADPNNVPEGYTPVETV